MKVIKRKQHKLTGNLVLKKDEIHNLIVSLHEEIFTLFIKKASSLNPQDFKEILINVAGLFLSNAISNCLNEWDENLFNLAIEAVKEQVLTILKHEKKNEFSALKKSARENPWAAIEINNKNNA